MDEINKINNLENKLRENIVGQNEVIDILTQSIKRYTCGFYGKNRPIVSMMFIGPTGTGKTEVVNLLGEHYFGSRKNIIRFDMSEYQDANSVSKLIGAPPGFIGYEEGGALTNQIKNNPFSVVLFDEFEKAHYKVYDLLLQILEEGNLTDSYGKTYSFQNAIIIMTSNVGFTHKKQSTMGYVSDIECAYNKDNLFYELKHVFRPEFLNRIDNIVPFEYLTEDNIIAIADNLIINTVVNIKQTKNITVTIDEKIKQQIYTQGMSTNYGARPLRSAILSHIIDPVAEKLLNEPLIKEINLT
jgi:ATP-dependent Clp protease ATP-binding subunit ClpC